ncbi:MAG: lytic murein transglycosylase [Beijerinckiaceae bacterium]|nr:lytic murein transglycosylase [Beijerinckiaceae bacterium]
MSLTPASAVDLTRYPQLSEMVDTLTSQHALNRDQILGWLANAKINKKVLAAMKRPSERLPWHRYRKLFVTEKSIDGGVGFLAKHRATLKRAYDDYGVSPEIIVAIIGIESRYGRNRGKLRVLDSLTTLALEYPRRSRFFSAELQHFLVLAGEAALDPPLVETGELSSVPKPPATDAVDADTKPASEPKAPAIGLKLPTAKPEVTAAPPPTPPSGPGSADPVPPRPRLEPQRPFAPQPAVAKGPKRRIWIIPAGIAVVVAMIAILAWKIRVKPETVARNTPAQTQPAQDNGKISDRVGGAKPDDSAQTTAQPTTEQPTTEPPATQPAPQDQPAQPTPQEQAAQPDQATQPSSEASKAAPPPASNPEVPVAYRSALLVEAPDLPSKVQTFAGTVVWKLNNVNNGPGDAVGLSVEADIDLPDDKTKVAVIFEKNSDSSLPASHTIKVRFTVGPGSYSGDVKQINVPQMRREGNTDGEPLAGVTVPVVQNSFLVGLSPGNAETANLRLLTDMPWVDIPILLTSGKIAKLTFEKGAAGQRDFAEAAAYWQKQ